MSYRLKRVLVPEVQLYKVNWRITQETEMFWKGTWRCSRCDRMRSDTRTSRAKPSSPPLSSPSQLPCVYFSAAWEKPLAAVWEHALALPYSRRSIKNALSALEGNLIIAVQPGHHALPIGHIGGASIAMGLCCTCGAWEGCIWCLWCCVAGVRSRKLKHNWIKNSSKKGRGSFWRFHRKARIRIKIKKTERKDNKKKKWTLQPSQSQNSFLSMHEHPGWSATKLLPSDLHTSQVCLLELIPMHNLNTLF